MECEKTLVDSLARRSSENNDEVIVSLVMTLLSSKTSYSCVVATRCRREESMNGELLFMLPFEWYVHAFAAVLEGSLSTRGLLFAASVGDEGDEEDRIVRYESLPAVVTVSSSEKNDTSFSADRRGAGF